MVCDFQFFVHGVKSNSTEYTLNDRALTGLFLWKRGVPMPGKLKLVVVFSFFFLTMCRGYAAPVSTIDGMSCRAYTAYFEQGFGTSKGLECYYTCPDEIVVGPLDFQADPAYSATKGDLDRLYCGIAPVWTATAVSTNIAMTTTASPISSASPIPTASATSPASPTAETSLTSQAPLFTGSVTMCDTGAALISFRLIEPPPDLTGKTLTAQIDEQESICAINPTNPSLMTCTLPTNMTFPARVVVSLDGLVVNDFTFDGIGCAELTTPIPTTTP
jgi:hypothetical protein